MKANRLVAGILLVAMLTGCATTQNSFYSDPTAVGDGQICRTLAGESVQADPQFQQALRTELRLRGVNEADCSAIVQNQNVAIGVGAILGAAIIAAAASSDNDSGGHGHGHHGRRYSSETYIDLGIVIPPASATVPVYADGQWDWDQYQNASGALVWGCRGVQSRQLVHPDQCTGKEMIDQRWPEKTF